METSLVALLNHHQLGHLHLYHYWTASFNKKVLMMILHPKFHRTISMFRAIEDNCKTLIKCSPSLVRVMTKKIGEGEITHIMAKTF